MCRGNIGVTVVFVVVAIGRVVVVAVRQRCGCGAIHDILCEVLVEPRVLRRGLLVLYEVGISGGMGMPAGSAELKKREGAQLVNKRGVNEREG